ncbi:oviduct-specific glyco protein [Rutstroemia sp. NJR-2017a WRK4]|nr:oviduct-specific glyco protein [Rutstroemia sp. NJR-2017a WRK4]
MASSDTLPQPTLQIAQVLADLNSLKQAPPAAALTLLHALNNLPTTRHNSRPSIHTTTPPKFDRLGRRIVSDPNSANQSPSARPTLSKEASTASSASNAVSEGSSDSVYGLKNVGADETDVDLVRAKELLIYYEKRDKLRDLGITGLKRSQERVNAVLAKQEQKEAEEREKVANMRRLGASGRR